MDAVRKRQAVLFAGFGISQKNMGLRELVWVKLYLLEHTGKDFEAKILLIS